MTDFKHTITFVGDSGSGTNVMNVIKAMDLKVDELNSEPIKPRNSYHVIVADELDRTYPKTFIAESEMEAAVIYVWQMGITNQETAEAAKCELIGRWYPANCQPYYAYRICLPRHCVAVGVRRK